MTSNDMYTVYKIRGSIVGYDYILYNNDLDEVVENLGDNEKLAKWYEFLLEHKNSLESLDIHVNLKEDLIIEANDNYGEWTKTIYISHNPVIAFGKILDCIVIDDKLMLEVDFGHNHVWYVRAQRLIFPEFKQMLSED